MTAVAEFRKDRFLENPLPSSEESEKVILGSILLDNTVFPQAAETLKPEHFYSSFHRNVFVAMADLVKQQKQIDPVLIGDQLKKLGSLDTFGGPAAIANLSHGIPFFAKISEHASIIQEKAAKRSLIRTCNRIEAEAFAEESDLAEILSRAESDIGKLLKNSSGPPSSAFKVRTVNQCLADAQGRNTPGKLFGDLWLEGNLTILFGGPGGGKTLLAVQAADHLSSGRSHPIFSTTVPAQKVLYFDFELSDKQFEGRYSRRDGDRLFDHYRFDSRFIRAEIDPDTFDPSSAASGEKYITASIEAEIVRTGAKVVIIDNITSIRNGTETAKDALPLMKDLNSLKRKHGLSIQVIAHTPKRDMSRPLSLNDLQGSAMLSNFADAVVGIGTSANDSAVRYIKQFKNRDGEITLDSDNVAVCEISKPENFLGLTFLTFGREREHLNAANEDTRKQMIESVKNLSKQGLSQREIAKEMALSLGAVNKYLRS